MFSNFFLSDQEKKTDLNDAAEPLSFDLDFMLRVGCR